MTQTIDINVYKVVLADLMTSGMPFENAFMTTMESIYNMGVTAGYNNAPFNSIDREMSLKYFREKLRVTGSLDQAYTKAAWKVYTHEYKARRAM